MGLTEPVPDTNGEADEDTDRLPDSGVGTGEGSNDTEPDDAVDADGPWTVPGAVCSK